MSSPSWGLVDSTSGCAQERHFLAFGKVLEIDLSDDTLIVLSGMQLGVRRGDGRAASWKRAWQEARQVSADVLISVATTRIAAIADHPASCSATGAPAAEGEDAADQRAGDQAAEVAPPG